MEGAAAALCMHCPHVGPWADSCSRPSKCKPPLPALRRARPLAHGALISAPPLLQIPDLAAFMHDYRMICPLAVQRIQRGLPATLEHADTGGVGGSGSLQVAADVADATAALINLSDVLALQQRAASELVPAVQSALGALNRARYITPGMTKREVLVGWATKLDGLRASDTVGEEDAQQMLMDVEGVHREFRDLLQTKR